MYCNISKVSACIKSTLSKTTSDISVTKTNRQVSVLCASELFLLPVILLFPTYTWLIPAHFISKITFPMLSKLSVPQLVTYLNSLVANPIETVVEMVLY